MLHQVVLLARAKDLIVDQHAPVGTAAAWELVGDTRAAKPRNRGQ